MKRKGFTLIELLAVIVILAIIAIITAFIIGNVLEQVKIKKYKAEEKAMEHAAELYLAKNQTLLGNDIESTSIGLADLVGYNYIKPVHDTGDGGVCYGTNNKNSRVLINVGEDQKSVTFKACLQCSDYHTSDQACGFDSSDTSDDDDTEKIIEDKKAYCLETETKDGTTYYYIDSVEDLYAFSDSVNSGTNYSGSVVSLRNNLDMSEEISTTQETCDGTEVEISTFKPIGNTTYSFNGTFEGNAKTISNLTINTSDLEYVGLFGNNAGAIKGLNLTGINITGTAPGSCSKSIVGGLVGYNTGNVSDINISGNVTSSGKCNSINIAGGVVGLSHKTDDTIHLENLLVNVVATSGGRDNGQYGSAAGIGYLDDADTVVSGVIDGGSIYAGYSGGYTCNTSPSCDNVYVKKGISLDRWTSTNGASDGMIFKSELAGNINGYDNVIDTYLGGDNDRSGYYFDYNSEGKIVVKSTKTSKIPDASKKLAGDGSASNPYKISSVSDWNVAVANIHYHYKLTNDIDFQNNEIYMLGSSGLSNSFDRSLDGDGYSLKNIKVTGIKDAGVIGHNTGVIENINFLNVEVQGDNYTGVIGHNLSTNDNNGLITGLNVISANINAVNYAGGLVGYNSGNIDEISVSGNVSAPVYASIAGGVVGYSKKVDETKTLNIKNVLVNANVTGKGTNKYSQAAGYASGIGYIYDSDTVVSGVIEGSSVIAGTNGSRSCNVSSCDGVYVIRTLDYQRWTDNGGGSYGTSFSETKYNDLYYYGNSLGLDTSYTGDSGNGYYFDYTSDNSDILVTKVGNNAPSSQDDIVEDEETGTKPTPGVVSKSYTSSTCENDTQAPTCTLNSFSARSQKDGMTASFTCTDNVGVTSISSLFDSTRESKARNFDDIGTIKPGIQTDNNGMYWFSTWTAYTDPTHPPQSGICYFFHYGAIDNCGNYSTYKTNYCLGYWLNKI